MSDIFGVDASGKTAGVCVLRAGTVLFEKTLEKGLTHSETLLPLVQSAMAATGLCPATVGLWALTAGPGSFTGLRIGMALVKGMAFPYLTEVVPVSTLAALAWGSGLAGTVITALDARRGQVYWAAFSCGKGVRRLAPDAVQNAQNSDGMKQIVHDSPGPVFFVGDGAEICYNSYICEPKVERPPQAHRVSIAKGAALLAAKMGGAVPAKDMQPCYLRLSQAERERAARLAPPEEPGVY